MIAKFLIYFNLILILTLNRLIKVNFNKLFRSSYISNEFSSKPKSMTSNSDYTLIKLANGNSYFQEVKTSKVISPFHDIPLYRNKSDGSKIYNMIVEIPRFTTAKMEINKKLNLNPIVQDVKNNKPRFVNNIFPYHGYIFNYGALPQTWEDPIHKDETTGCVGDNDPMDACEIGTQQKEFGSVIGVKLLGSLGMVDEGEADWKVVVIDVNDPLANKLNDINDVGTHMPGLLEAMIDWFKIYKVPTGKPANTFAINKQNGKEIFDKNFTVKLIEDHNKAWLNLMSQKYDPKKCQISTLNTCLNNLNSISSTEAKLMLDNETKKIKNEKSSADRNQYDSATIEEIHYINRKIL